MDKNTLRQRMRALGPIDPATGAMVVSHLRRWLSGRLPGTISAYLAMSDEIDVISLFGDLPGWRWVLPRVETDGSLTFRDRDLPRERHPLGMSQPVGAGAVVTLAEIDVVLVPGLAFDRSGGRLGRGKGYYDAVLAERRADTVAVGVTIAVRIVESVPRQPHDQSVDWLVTEDEVIECSPRR